MNHPNEMTEAETSAALHNRLYGALREVPVERVEVDAAERAIRDHYGIGNEIAADRFITQVRAEAEHGEEVDNAREAAHQALTVIEQGVAQARKALAMSMRAYDVEIVEGAALSKIEAALTHISLLVDGARANVPAVGA